MPTKKQAKAPTVFVDNLLLRRRGKPDEAEGEAFRSALFDCAWSEGVRVVFTFDDVWISAKRNRAKVIVLDDGATRSRLEALVRTIGYRPILLAHADGRPEEGMDDLVAKRGYDGWLSLSSASDAAASLCAWVFEGRLRQRRPAASRVDARDPIDVSDAMPWKELASEPPRDRWYAARRRWTRDADDLWTLDQTTYEAGCALPKAARVLFLASAFDEAALFAGAYPRFFAEAPKLLAEVRTALDVVGGKREARLFARALQTCSALSGTKRESELNKLADEHRRRPEWPNPTPAQLAYLDVVWNKLALEPIERRVGPVSGVRRRSRTRE
jgi:hypothetical protein